MEFFKDDYYTIGFQEDDQKDYELDPNNDQERLCIFSYAPVITEELDIKDKINRDHPIKEDGFFYYSTRKVKYIQLPLDEQNDILTDNLSYDMDMNIKFMKKIYLIKI